MNILSQAFVIALLFTSLVANALTLEGRVVGVADGDTITVLDNTKTQYKIRLAGIDAPEKSQSFDNVSKKSLSDLVYGKPVTIDYTKQDRYGRLVGKVLHEGSDINYVQIQRGLAWFYHKYKSELSVADQSAYQQAEEAAHTQRLGLWADPQPIAPWDYRNRKSKR